MIKAADDLFTGIFLDLENYQQKFEEIGPMSVQDKDIGEVAAVLDELEEARSAVHMPEARKAFEEAARKDLGHPNP